MKQRKILIFGKTGDGKSSAGNTILGEKVFFAKASASSVTTESKSVNRTAHGRNMTVIDTPGFFDTNLDDKTFQSEIIKALVECAPGIDAFVIVLRVGRYTKQETEVIEQLLKPFQEDALKHAVILFTFGEQLEDQTLEEFMKDNKELKKVLGKCGCRYHVIDNKYWADRQSGDKSNRVQVKNLLETIDKMVEKNGRYTNELLEYLEEDIQQEMKNVPETNLSPEAKREKAKKIVCEKSMHGKKQNREVWIQALVGVGSTIVGVLAILAAVLKR